VAKNNKTSFFYVLYSNKTWFFDQSELAQGPISIMIKVNSSRPGFQSRNYKDAMIKNRCNFQNSFNRQIYQYIMYFLLLPFFWITLTEKFCKQAISHVY